MANVKQYLSLDSAKFQTTAYPQILPVQGTNFPMVGALAFDATTSEKCFFKFSPVNYGSGSITVTVEWYADTASTGAVTFETAIAAITPNTDTQDMETKAFATANTASDTHLGTTGQRDHSFDITASNTDSLTVGDSAWLRLARLPADAGDTMAGDCIVTGVMLTYSDT